MKEYQQIVLILIFLILNFSFSTRIKPKCKREVLLNYTLPINAYPSKEKEGDDKGIYRIGNYK